MKRIPLAILVGVAVLASTMSQAAQRTGERAASLSRAVFKKSVEVIMADRHSKCMSAIGSAAFCTCLSSHLPIKADFQTYIRVTTTSREEYGYERLAPEDKRTVDHIIATRDYCVAQVFATP